MSLYTLSASSPKARKIHYCDWCEQRIEVGEQHERWSNVDDGTVVNQRCHTDCIEALDKSTGSEGYFCGATIHKRGENCQECDD